MSDIKDIDDYEARFGFLWKRRSVEKLEGVAYTEDDIPVRKIFVSNIKNNLANDDSLREIFSSYGEVESVSILNSPNCYRRTAFVTFIDAKDAATVLANSCEFNQLRISSAYSWQQPEPPTGSEEEEDTNTESQNDAISILMLNDDCLREIFSYLDLIDLTKISKVCQRFATLAETVFKSHEHVDVTFIRIYSDITLLEWKEVLETMGHHIKSLFIKPQSFLNPPGIKMFKLILNNCCNLETLSLEEFSLTQSVYQLKPLLRRLKTLILDNCTVRQNFMDMFNASWLLETLHFKNSYEVTGARVYLLTNLKTLAFTLCGNIQPVYLSQLLMHQQNLESLSLICCDRITSSILRDIGLYSTKITELNIEFSPGHRYNCRQEDLIYIANLPHLKKLQFECDTSINISSLLTIIAERNLLEELNVSCRTINEDSFEAILKLTNLKVLHINRTNVSEKWLSKIGEHLVNLTELHMIHSVQVGDNGLMELLRNAINLKLIDISRTSVTLDGLVNCLKLLCTQLGQRPVLEIWISSIDFPTAEEHNERKQKLEPYKNVAKVEFSVGRALETFYKYFSKVPESDTMSGNSWSDVYNSEDDLYIF